MRFSVLPALTVALSGSLLLCSTSPALEPIPDSSFPPPTETGYTVSGGGHYLPPGGTIYQDGGETYSTPFSGPVVNYPPEATWHRGYYHTAWGRPVALVVPPTARYQTNWGWGIGNTRMTPIYPQFGGPTMGGQYADGEGFRATPRYVSDTEQFGVYYIRGPW